MTGKVGTWNIDRDYKNTYWFQVGERKRKKKRKSWGKLSRLCVFCVRTCVNLDGIIVDVCERRRCATGWQDGGPSLTGKPETGKADPPISAAKIRGISKADKWKDDGCGKKKENISKVQAGDLTWASEAQVLYRINWPELDRCQCLTVRCVCACVRKERIASSSEGSRGLRVSEQSYSLWRRAHSLPTSLITATDRAQPLATVCGGMK